MIANDTPEELLAALEREDELPRVPGGFWARAGAMFGVALALSSPVTSSHR